MTTVDTPLRVVPAGRRAHASLLFFVFRFCLGNNNNQGCFFVFVCDEFEFGSPSHSNSLSHGAGTCHAKRVVNLGAKQDRTCDTVRIHVDFPGTVNVTQDPNSTRDVACVPKRMQARRNVNTGKGQPKGDAHICLHKNKRNSKEKQRGARHTRQTHTAQTNTKTKNGESPRWGTLAQTNSPCTSVRPSHIRETNPR